VRATMSAKEILHMTVSQEESEEPRSWTVKGSQWCQPSHPLPGFSHRDTKRWGRPGGDEVAGGGP
jgi:hypothetical protein